MPKTFQSARKEVKMAELQITKVTFIFEDGSQRVLEGEELEAWTTICYLYSDYLLPGAPNHVLAKLFGGIVRGFVPPQAITKRRR